MKILALETCFKYCSAAVIAGGEIVAAQTFPEKNRQAEMLLSQVDGCLDKARCKFDEIDYIAVTCGPGSFTGVRIGLAAAHGLKYGLRNKNNAMIAISTLELIWHVNGKHDCLVALNTGRSCVYVQKFCGTLADALQYSKPELIRLENLEQYATDLPIIGDVGEISKFTPPTAAEVALAAYDFMQSGVVFKDAIPLYIGRPDAYRL